MKKTIRHCLISGAILLSSYCAFGQLEISQGFSGQSLADTLCGNGIMLSNVTHTGDELAFCSFSGGSSTNLGMNEGVALCSGSVLSITGPNNSTSTSTNFGNPGDPDLTDLAGMDTYDAALLEFDFIPAWDTLKCEFIFGSIEDSVIYVEVPQGTDPGNLVASFSIPAGVKATVSGIIQQSGVTPNDFTDPLDYLLSGDGDKNWTVIVSMATDIQSIQPTSDQIEVGSSQERLHLNNISGFSVCIYNLSGQREIQIPEATRDGLWINCIKSGIYLACFEKGSLQITKKIMVY